MKELSAVRYEESRSRFFAHLYEIEDLSDLEGILKFHRREYKKAVHHCYATRSRSPDGTMRELSKDDGEVGHPGKVLLLLLVSKGMDHHAIVVSRVFGGIKLGVGGVSRAFRSAGEAVICRNEGKDI